MQTFAHAPRYALALVSQCLASASLLETLDFPCLSRQCLLHFNLLYSACQYSWANSSVMSSFFWLRNHTLPRLSCQLKAILCSVSHLCIVSEVFSTLQLQAAFSHEIPILAMAYPIVRFSQETPYDSLLKTGKMFIFVHSSSGL